MLGDIPGAMFGSKSEVNPVSHLIGTAIGWGGNPTEAAVYLGAYPKANDGKVTAIDRVSGFKLPEDSSMWLAYKKAAPQGARGNGRRGAGAPAAAAETPATPTAAPATPAPAC